MSDLFGNIYNPDVLSCLANLSNDEVFTSPDVVNKMLDMLPQEIFANHKIAKDSFLKILMNVRGNQRVTNQNPED